MVEAESESPNADLPEPTETGVGAEFGSRVRIAAEVGVGVGGDDVGKGVTTWGVGEGIWEILPEPAISAVGNAVADSSVGAAVASGAEVFVLVAGTRSAEQAATRIIRADRTEKHRALAPLSEFFMRDRIIRRRHVTFLGAWLNSVTCYSLMRCQLSRLHSGDDIRQPDRHLSRYTARR